MNNTYTINFDDIESFIDNHFFNDSKSKEIIKKAGFTETQIKVINTLILAALKAYDLKIQ